MRKTIQHTWSLLLSGEKTRFCLLAVADLVVSIADIVSLAAVLCLLHFYLSETPTFLSPWLSNNQSWPLICFVFLFALKNVMGFRVNMAHYRFAASVSARLSRNGLMAFQQGTYESYLKDDASLQIRKISFHPFEFGQFVLTGLQQMLTQIVLISLTCIAILLFNAELFLLLFLLILPPSVLSFFWVKKKMNTIRKDVMDANQYSLRYLLDAIKGWIEGNVYRKNDKLGSRFFHWRRKFGDALFKSAAWQQLPSRMIEIFAIAGLFTLVFLARFVDHSESDAFLTLGAFTAAAYKIIPGLVKIINAASQLKAYSPAVMVLQKEAVARKTFLDDARITSIRFDKVCFGFNNAKLVDQFSFHLQSGDFALLTGNSGAGKSTVMNILLGFLQPCSGQIFVNEKQELSGVKKFWPKVSYVKQQNFIMQDSILDNITFREDNYDVARLYTVLKITGLDLIMDQFPEGLQTMLSENGGNISGGQRQRICLARALYRDADLYLLDEPLNELDIVSEEIILKHFQKLAESGKIILMVAHSNSSNEFCNKVVDMSTMETVFSG